MFSTILQYEFRHWFRQPTTYLFLIFFFGITYVTATGMASESSSRYLDMYINSASYIHRIVGYFNILIYFLLPIIIGQTVYRDYKDGMHHVLYSYPFQKKNYLLAKFISGYGIVALIVGMMALGFWCGVRSPWTNADLITNEQPLAYLQVFGVFMLPNMLLIGTIVFSAVTFTRNIYVGFITVFAFLFFQATLAVILGQLENGYLAALLNPTGETALQYYTRYWTTAQKNNNLLPMGDVIFLNRIIWLFITLAIFVWTYRKFKFSQFASDRKKKKQKNTETTIVNTNQVITFSLPKTKIDPSFWQQVKTTWTLSNIDLKYIIKNWSFATIIIGGILAILFTLNNTNPKFGTPALPVTSQMLDIPAMFFAGLVNLLTFLYSGMLIQRAKMSQMNQLIDTSFVPDWVLLLSKFIALVKMQFIVLALLIVGGIVTQISKGFYDFEIGQYLFNIYVVNFIHFVIWAMLAIFVHILFNNIYIGFLFLLLMPVGYIGLSEFALKAGLPVFEQAFLRFNQEPNDILGLPYSDMDGYGPNLPRYFIYKTYWLIAGLGMLAAAYLLWIRGIPFAFGQRIRLAAQRINRPFKIISLGFFIVFVSFGCSLYYTHNIQHPYYNRDMVRQEVQSAYKKYKRYEKTVQPKIVDVKINLDIFPKERQLKATGTYLLINKSKQAIDTLIMTYMADTHTELDFDQPVKTILKDSIADKAHFEIHLLQSSLQPGDSLRLNFKIHSDPMGWIHTNDLVKENGTYIEDDIFPRFGNWLNFLRQELGYSYNDEKPMPSDTTALSNSFSSIDSDRITFESTVSTDADQIALAPGYLQREWTENGRRYFHYQMEHKIAHSFLFTSGRYQVKRDKWNDIDLEIYYHEKHPYNLDRMMAGMKAGLDYCSKNFSPYQFKQVRIVEFSQALGGSAHAFPNTIPTGEGAGFIADVHDHDHDHSHDGSDYAFGTAVHEVAHQWWGHQVQPADVQGAKMVVESMAEYVNAMVKKKEKGIKKLRDFNKHNRKMYLHGRSMERELESPLLYSSAKQNYIHYPKGAIVLSTLADYVGEEKLNQAISRYVQKVAGQEQAPYTTSEELLDSIRTAVPDSLQYLIKDWFETVTLYDNTLNQATVTPTEDGQYQIDIDLSITKYRSGPGGERRFGSAENDSLTHIVDANTYHSLPLRDYLEIGVFIEDDNKEKEIYLKQHRFDQIDNHVTIIVDKKPVRVAIDPYDQFIDARNEDNYFRF